MPHTPLKRTCLPIPPLRQWEAQNYQTRIYFFAGELEGAGVVADLASGDAAGLAEVEAAGDASGLALAAGEAAGEAAGLAAGIGCAAGAPSPITVLTPKPGIEKINANNMNVAANTTVAFSSGFCGPRGPKAD